MQHGDSDLETTVNSYRLIASLMSTSWRLLQTIGHANRDRSSFSSTTRSTAFTLITFPRLFHVWSFFITAQRLLSSARLQLYLSQRSWIAYSLSHSARKVLLRHLGDQIIEIGILAREKGLVYALIVWQLIDGFVLVFCSSRRKVMVVFLSICGQVCHGFCLCC